LDNLTNATAIGFNAVATASNQVRIGNTSVTSIGGQVGWTNFSDGRYKKNIKEDVPGLEFINRLRPVTYNLDVEEIDKVFQNDITKLRTTTASSATSASTSKPGLPIAGSNATNQLQADMKGRLVPTAEDVVAKQTKSSVTYTGFVAQEVEKAAKEVGYNFSGVDIPKSDRDFYGLRYSEFVVPLVMALQELSKKTDMLEKQNAELKKRLEKLELEIVNRNSNTSRASLNSVQLEQNVPNPFARTTTIAYTLPAGTQKAELLISDYSGKVIKTIGIFNTGRGTMSIDASLYNNGTYNYSIVIDGRTVETRKMMIMK
jgi:hypothetical protein